MSHSSINDKLRQLAKDIQAGVDNSELVKAIAMPNEKHTNGLGFVTRCIMVWPKHTGDEMANPSGDYSAIMNNLNRTAHIKKNVKHTGWIVLQRLHKPDGTPFISSLFCDTKAEADLLASALNNVVAIMPIEWEE